MAKYKFHLIKKLALDTQGIKHPSNLNAWDIDEMTARYVLYASDFKGQTSVATAASGGGIGIEASFNPLGFIGLNTEISGGFGASLAHQLGVVVTRGPAALELQQHHCTFYNSSPFVLNSFIGYLIGVNGELGIEVSVGWSHNTALGASDPSWSHETTRSTRSNLFRKPQEEEDEPQVDLELLSMKIEAKAGLQAQWGGAAEWYYAEDPRPVTTDSNSNLVKILGTVLRRGSTKSALKEEVYDFLNKQNKYFNYQTRSYDKWHGGEQSTVETLRILEKYRPTIPTMYWDDRDEVLALVDHYIGRLKAYVQGCAGDAFLSISTQESESRLGAFASAGLEARALGLGGGAEFEAFAGWQWSQKRAKARFQTHWEMHDGRRDPSFVRIMATFDTVIKYSTGSGPGNSLNRMTYVSSIVFWQRPSHLGLAPHQAGTVEAQTCPGTGIAVGESCVVSNLQRIYKKYWSAVQVTRHDPFGSAKYKSESTISAQWQESATEDRYVQALASRLGVSSADFLRFLEDDQVRAAIWEEPFVEKDVALLVEATFKVWPGTVVQLHCKVDKNNNEVVQLDPQTGTRLGSVSRTFLPLESMRLRYRKQDLMDASKTRFSLGFKFFGTEGKIKLEQISKAGADGIVDLCTVFFDKTLLNLYNRDPTQAYENAVPAAVLFCQ